MSIKNVLRRLVSSPNVARGPADQGRTASDQRVSDTQRKTIEVLHGDAFRPRDKRIECLKSYEKKLIEGKEPKPAALKPKAQSVFSKAFAIRASIPITAADAKSVITFLNNLKKKDKYKVNGNEITSLNFPKGLKNKERVQGAALDRVLANDIGCVSVSGKPTIHGDKIPSFGLDFSVSKDGLNINFYYRPAPGSLRLPDEKRAQGELGLRFAAAREVIVKSASQRIRGKSAEKGLNQTDLNNTINIGVEDLLSGDRTVNLLGYETPPLDDVAWQDFSEYLHALPLSVMSVLLHREPVVPEVVGTLITIEKAGVDSSELSQFLTALNSALWTRIVTDVSAFLMLDPEVTWEGLPEFPEQIIPEIQEYIIQVANQCYSGVVNALQGQPEVIATLAEIYWALSVEYRQTYVNWIAAAFRPADQEPGEFYVWTSFTGQAPNRFPIRWAEVASLAQALWGWALKALPTPEEKPELPEIVPPYDFAWFTPRTWNLGLRLVYRQEWRALGNQRGEVIKTIPLGPRQTEKVSTRLTRRTKVLRTSENLKSIETTTEMATSAKDSSETIYETATKKKWHVEADASIDFGFGGASMSYDREKEEEDRFKDTTTHLTESSQKMASKIRQETKVTVSTESESTFETTTATEIINPNEEIALTYVYSKLQRQYRLFTQLAEVHNVVMIAEPLPAPEQIDDEWVRRHDSILAKVLLDDSYRDVLASFGQDRPQESIDQDTLNAIKGALDNVAGASGYLQEIGKKAVSISLDSVDPSQEAQRGYRDTQHEQLERKRAHNLLVQKQRRFKQHIRDNLLHYHRAIWSSEDPQQRALRYRKLGIQVPLRWEFVVGAPNAPDVLSLTQLLEALTQIADGTRPYGELHGFFRPVVPSETVGFADLINNSEPIGYEGNYAIYYLNPRFEKTDLFLMLQILKAPYIDENELGQQTVVDPALKALKRERFGEGPTSYAEQLDMACIVPELRLKHAIAKKNGAEAEKIFFTVYKLTRLALDNVNNAAAGEANFVEDVNRLNQLLNTDQAKIRRNEEDFTKFLLDNNLSDKFLEAYRDLLCRYSDQGLFTTLYPEYLLRKNQGSAFLLDTGNLVVDIVPGTGSALESFKLMHRGIDVLKALEEKTRSALENKRREELIRTEKYGDPDIEKVTIVTGAKEAAGLVATSIETESGSRSAGDKPKAGRR